MVGRQSGSDKREDAGTGTTHSVLRFAGTLVTSFICVNFVLLSLPSVQWFCNKDNYI